MYNSFNKTRITRNDTKKKILKSITFSYINWSDEYTFLFNSEQWYSYIIDIIDKKLFKTKATKDWKLALKLLVSFTSKINKDFDKIHISSKSCCQDGNLQLPESLQTDGNIAVPTMK